MSSEAAVDTQTVDPFKKSQSHYSQICGKDLRFEHGIWMYIVDVCPPGFDLVTCCQHTHSSAQRGLNSADHNLTPGSPGLGADR